MERGAGGEPWVLALDIGTSSIRASLYDQAGRTLAPSPVLQLSCRWYVTSNGGMEASPTELLDLTLQVIDAAVERVREARLGIAAVATATFWHTLLGLDAEGAPRTPVFGWGDTRAAGAATRLRARLDAAEVHRRTGCFLHALYPAAKLLWLREAHPDTFRSGEHWVGFGEYLYLHLFGERRASLSLASGSGLLDQQAMRWDAAVLEAVGLAPAALFPLAEPDRPFRGLVPDFARRWPELAQVPWLPPVGDGACASVGSGAIGPRRFALTVGTSAALRVVWEGEEEMGLPPDLWSYRLDGRRRVAGGAFSNGGNAVAFLERTLQLPPRRERDAAVAALEPDGHRLTVLPFLLGERSPGPLQEARAGVLGMRQGTTPLEIYRAWLEGVAYRIGHLDRQLATVFGVPDLVLAGGGALHASRLWTQIIADVLGRSLTLAGEEETTSRGAALLALEWLGILSGLQQAPALEGETFHADSERHARYRAAGQRQRELEELLVPWMARQSLTP